MTGCAHAVRLAAALLWFWVLHFHVQEARTWFERLLARFPATVPHGPRSQQRATVLYGAGMFAFGADDFATAHRRLQESADTWRAVGHTRNLAHALTWLGKPTEGRQPRDGPRSVGGEYSAPARSRRMRLGSHAR